MNFNDKILKYLYEEFLLYLAIVCKDEEGSKTFNVNMLKINRLKSSNLVY